MAQTVNLRESEYQAIVSELEQMHENVLENLNATITMIRTLVTSEGTFSTELTSKKMTDMADTVSNDIIALLKQAFQDSEAGVANMIKSAMDLDSTGG